MKFLLILVKLFLFLSLVLGLIRNYMKEKSYYSKFRLFQHIITILTVVFLFLFFLSSVLYKT